MGTYSEVAQLALTDLFTGPVTANRFRDWVREKSSTIELLRTYAFGEIFWEKSIGRPQTALLSDGFTIEAWRVEEYLHGEIGGAVSWKTRNVDYFPSWWDGPEDEKIWRVSFIVPNMQDGHVSDGIHNQPTYIVPRLAGSVAWRPPGSIGIFAEGLRLLEPSSAAFVKGAGPVRLSFEVVMIPFITFDKDGNARQP